MPRQALRSAPNAIFTGGVVAGNGSCCACSPGGAVAQRLRGFKSAEPEKTVKRSSRRTGVNLQFFPVQPSSLGLKGASSPFFVAPARRNRCDFAAQTGLRLESPTGAFMPCRHRRTFLLFWCQKRTSPAAASCPAERLYTPLATEEAKKQNAQVPKNLCVMAGVVSFELTARGFGDRCSTS